LGALNGLFEPRVDLEGADFSESYIGDFDERAPCKNPTLEGSNEKTGAETRISANCKT